MGARFEVQGVDAGTPVGEAAPLILRAKAAPLFELERAVLARADEESVHDMRVASRRTREAMRLLAPVYRRRVLEPWRDRVRAVTRALGPVRDADVFIEAITSLGPDLTAGGRQAAAFLVGYSMGTRARELERLGDDLSGVAISRDRTAFESAIARTRENGAARQPLRRLACGAIEARANEVVADQRRALAGGDDEQHHALRIAYKRLRYAVEVFRPCYGEGFDELYGVLSAYQDALGDMHDVQVFSAVIDERHADGSAARAGVRRPDLDVVRTVLAPRADDARGRFARLTIEHPAGDLRRALLAPLVDEAGASCA